MRKNNLHTYNRNSVTHLVTFLLVVALFCTAAPVSAWSDAVQTRATNVENSSSPAQKPTPSPSPSTSPAPSLQASPTPTPTAVQSKTAVTTKSLAELQTRISNILRRPELAQALVGVKVASLDTGRVLFEENAMKLVRPASNMKLY